MTIIEDAPVDAAALHLLLAPVAPDAPWRGLLERQALPYSVLHGDDAAQLAAAWGLLAPRLGLPVDAAPGDTPAPRAGWTWRCDKCSDPACEHRLFRDLVAAREDVPPGSA